VKWTGFIGVAERNSQRHAPGESRDRPGSGGGPTPSTCWRRASRPGPVIGPHPRSRDGESSTRSRRRGRGPYAGGGGLRGVFRQPDSCHHVRRSSAMASRAPSRSAPEHRRRPDPKTEWLRTCSKARGLILGLRMAAARPTYMILVIDNYDSFTTNPRAVPRRAWASCTSCATTPSTRRCRCAATRRIVNLARARHAGRRRGWSLDVIPAAGEHTPILGVCSGIRPSAQAFGARWRARKRRCHGKTSESGMTGVGCRRPVDPAHGTRYHSLVIAPHTVPVDSRSRRGAEDGRDSWACVTAAGREGVVPPGVHPHRRGEAAGSQLPGQGRRRPVSGTDRARTTSSADSRARPSGAPQAF